MKSPLKFLKPLLVSAACICAISAFAETAPAQTETPAATADEKAQPEAVSVVVLIRDPENGIFEELRPAVAATILAEVANTGITPQSSEFLSTEKRDKDSPALSPAEVAELSGADYVLVVQIPTPQETVRQGVSYVRQTIFYTLFSNAGVVAASGSVSDIASASANGSASETFSLLSESLLLKTAKKAGLDITDKLASGKVKLEKAATRADVDVLCVVEEMSFPKIIEDENGEISIASEPMRVSIPGVNLKIGGLDYALRADGNPTKISLPIGVPLNVSVSHPAIIPIERTYKIEKRGDSLTIFLTLNKEAHDRWERDLNEITALIEQLKDNDASRETKAADAEMVREKAKSWENSGMVTTEPKSEEPAKETTKDTGSAQ